MGSGPLGPGTKSSTQGPTGSHGIHLTCLISSLLLFPGVCRGFAARRLKHVQRRGVLLPWVLGTHVRPRIELHPAAPDIAARCVVRPCHGATGFCWLVEGLQAHSCRDRAWLWNTQSAACIMCKFSALPESCTHSIAGSFNVGGGGTEHVWSLWRTWRLCVELWQWSSDSGGWVVLTVQ